jgi:hemoglobin
MSTENKTVPTLYSWAGGDEALQKLTETFYSKIATDEILSEVFRHMGGDHPKRVAHFIGEVFGGHNCYTQEDQSNHAGMIAHHLGRFLTEQQRKRWMTLLLETADEIGLPTDPEFRSAFVGYLEWGTRLAVINSNVTENPVTESEPMPKWGWGETKGPYIP